MYTVQGIRDTKIKKIQSLIQKSLYFPGKNKKLNLIFKLSYNLGKGKKWGILSKRNTMKVVNFIKFDLRRINIY